LRLTLWYCLVLGVALVLFSVALYLSVQYFLLQPVADAAAASANGRAHQWFADPIDHGCKPPGVSSNSSGQPGQFGPPNPGQSMYEIVACFDQNGSLMAQSGYSTLLPSAFLANNLAQSALQSPSGRANDIVNGGSVGPIYRTAQVVSGPTGNVGVIVIGEYIQTQENDLSLLLTLLLVVGGVALLGAGAGGLFLSNRALAPARLSWTNQQRFIADAAHELRTPLTLLRADAEVLLRGRERLDEDDAALLEDIVAEAHHMSNLATNLLTLARLDTGSIHREHEVVNLAALVKEGAQRVQAFAGQRGVSIEVESSGDAYVIGDPVLLEQAMLVLLDNAIKYNRQGGRVIARTAEQDGHMFLEVRDTGIGIAAEHLPHLGERFYRVDKARSREAGGTGLGISIAQRIALAHEGQLTLSSVPEQGTIVKLALPPAHGDFSDSLEISDTSLSEKPL
jgi:signal transduction histidine kinase